MKKYSFIITVALTLLIVSCANKPSEPDQEYINPYNIQIELINENVVELSWEESTLNNNTFIISKKIGETSWIENYRELEPGTTSLIDSIYVQAFIVYSYYLKEMSDYSIIGTSDTVAWFSVNAIPTELTLEQIKQDSIKLTWHDNSYGEFLYGIDRKIGDSNWIENYKLYEPEASNGYNSYMNYVDYSETIGDSIYYRLYILNGISKSDYSECSIYASLLPPIDLKAAIEDNGIKLNWMDNYQNETGFAIERKVHGSEFQEICTLGANITSYLDDNLDPSVIYYYRIRVFSTGFISDYSNTVIGNIDHEGYWIPLDYETIQDAIDDSYSSSIIIVLPGVHYENVQINDKYPDIRSFYSVFGDEEYIEQTVIDGNQNGSVFAFVNCDSGSPSISGLTLQNGSGNYSNVTGSGWYYYSGGGILCENSDITISNMIIKDNITEIGGGLACLQNSNCTISNTLIIDNKSIGSLSENGGGIYCNESEITIDDSAISDNNASSGAGGILIINSIAQITNSTFSSNVSGGSGGGIYIRTGSDATLENLVVSNNISSFSGGGIVSSHTSPIMRNIVFSGNSSGKGGGIAFWSDQEPVFENILLINNNANTGGGIFSAGVDLNINNVTAYGNTADGGGGVLCCGTGADPLIMNSIFWNNSPQEVMIAEVNWPSPVGSVTVQYSDIMGGPDNIVSSNPSNVNWLNGNLVTDPFFQDPGNDDFHLQTDSPCIDAGNPDPQYNDSDGSRNDMGAYGGPGGNW